MGLERQGDWGEVQGMPEPCLPGLPCSGQPKSLHKPTMVLLLGAGERA